MAVTEDAILAQIPMINTTARDERLPRWPTQRATQPSDKVLVVYSGPTELVDRAKASHPQSSAAERKKELYRVNFEYFLKHGVQCKTQDTVLVVTSSVEEFYRERVKKIHEDCMRDHNHQVLLIIRENKCADLETVRRVMQDDVVDIFSYDFFVYANCGSSGPSSKWAHLPWTDLLIEKLNDQVKMSGLSLNCAGDAHIQSMVYALDRKGIEIIKDSYAIFDCRKVFPKNNRTKQKNFIVRRYELGLSYWIMRNGYAISSLINPTVVTMKNRTKCMKDPAFKDMWYIYTMGRDYGRVLNLEDTVFFKTSRMMSKSTAKDINFTLDVNWVQKGRSWSDTICNTPSCDAIGV